MGSTSTWNLKSLLGTIEVSSLLHPPPPPLYRLLSTHELRIYFHNSIKNSIALAMAKQKRSKQNKSNLPSSIHSFHLCGSYFIIAIRLQAGIRIWIRIRMRGWVQGVGGGGVYGKGSETSNAQIIECAVRTKDPPHDDGCWVVKARWRGEGKPGRDRGRRLSCMCRWRKDSSSNSGSCKLSWKLFPLANALRTNKFL